MDLGIRGKVALVTAASRGLGRECAQKLAAEHCRVAICSRHRAGAEQTAGEIAAETGAEVIGFEADMGDAGAIDRLLDQVRTALGDPEILVANAGGPPPGTFASTSLDLYEQALRLNLMSGVRLIHGTAPAMKERGWGRIIAITSLSVKQPIGDLLLSNMARAGLTGFLKTVSTELAPFGVTVNAILPGFHKTSRNEQVARQTADRENKSVKEVFEGLAASIPCRRIGDPADFGAAAAFLASEQANYITGQNLLIDGGSYGGLL